MAIKLDGDVRSLETKVLFEIRHAFVTESDKPLAAVSSLPKAQRLVNTVYKGHAVKIVMTPINHVNRIVWQNTMRRMVEWSE